jgi:hypothetical protein
VKKLVLLVVIVAAGVYLTGAVNLSESRANGFLNQLEHLTLQGNGDEFCAYVRETAA